MASDSARSLVMPSPLKIGEGASSTRVKYVPVRPGVIAEVRSDGLAMETTGGAEDKQQTILPISLNFPEPPDKHAAFELQQALLYPFICRTVQPALRPNRSANHTCASCPEAAECPRL